MLSVQLSKSLEKRINKIVQEDFHGDIQSAFINFLKLHNKYGWKEQLMSDVQSIRAGVNQMGGISSHTIDEAVKAYRKSVSNQNA